MNRFLTAIFMLSLISFMILLTSFIEYDNNESKTQYNVYYVFDNVYNNKPIIDSIMKNKSNIELIRANKLNEVESKLNEIESIYAANVFRDINFNLSIDIIEREPLVYYEKNDSYIDFSGKIIRRNKKLDDRLPILSGYASKDNIRILVDVIRNFNEDKFLNKELKRAERHKDWLRKNLPNTKMEKENQKQILKLHTAIRCDYQSV